MKPVNERLPQRRIDPNWGDGQMMNRWLFINADYTKPALVRISNVMDMPAAFWNMDDSGRTGWVVVDKMLEGASIATNPSVEEWFCEARQEVYFNRVVFHDKVQVVVGIKVATSERFPSL